MTASVTNRIPEADAAVIESRIESAEKQSEALRAQLVQAEAQVRSAQLAYSRISSKSKSQKDAYSALESQLEQQQDRLTQEAAELELTRVNLNEQTAAKNSLQAKLSDVYDRLDQETSEVKHLENVASTVPASFPLTEQAVGEGDAKEILGARDLHIVDVYDVDDSGTSSRAYGRIYYVNHSELIFYAFDLSKLERSHKVVAFQAWGFRQPQSSTVESLGLFYLENATLNRWTLRVADPQILSRIDSLFVTVEPPGGSRFPKGKRLLMASLAGPPNHP
jgi:hypothetical protein